MSSSLDHGIREWLKSVLIDVAKEVHYRPTRSEQEPTRDNVNQTPLLLRSKDAAEMLAISERLLWRLTQADRIPCVRIGRLVRYSPDALREWIALPDSARKLEPEVATSSRPTSSVRNKFARRGSQKSKKLATGESVQRHESNEVRKAINGRGINRQKKRSENASTESQPRSIRAFFATRLGVAEETLPQLTNGEIMPIADLDIPSLHGWTYRTANCPMPPSLSCTSSSPQASNRRVTDLGTS